MSLKSNLDQNNKITENKTHNKVNENKALDNKRQALLDAALKLFVEFGFHGTPTSKIAKEAAVANGTLFHYFPSKEDLIIALYIEVKKNMSDYIESNSIDNSVNNSAANQSIRDSLKSQYLNSIYWFLDHKLEFHYIQLFSSSPYFNQLNQSINKQSEMSEQIKNHHQQIYMAIESKIFKKMPVDLLMILLSSHVYSLTQYLIGNQLNKAEQHTIINDSFEMLWDMLT